MVVGDVIEYDDMIEIVDEHTGIPFKPNVIMSTKNLTRGTSRSDPWRSPRAPEGLSPTTHLRLFGSILATASRIEFASKSMKWDSHTSIVPLLTTPWPQDPGARRHCEHEARRDVVPLGLRGVVLYRRPGSGSSSCFWAGAEAAS